MSNPVTYSTRGPVAVITMDRPPVNSLGADLRTGIVDAHGGRVSLESQIGVGTTVSIHLRAES